MKKCLFAMIVAALAVPASAISFLGHDRRAFRPLQADPRELQLSLRHIVPVGRKSVGEVAAGQYFNLATWSVGSTNAFVQWGMGGGIFSRFDLVASQKDLQVSDYNASMPIDVHSGRWSVRVLPYHISSHLGDDLIKRTGLLPQKYSFDAVKELVAFEPSRTLRLYGGYNYIIRWEHDNLGRHAFQTGLEWTMASLAKGSIEPFLASDFQTWERIGWNPISHTQLGVHFRNNAEAKESLSLYLEYAAGHREHGQTYDQQESHWGLGLRLELW